MPAGPHVPTISVIRSALEEVPSAIRDDDPSTDPRGIGTGPAVAIRISDPECLESLSDGMAVDSHGVRSDVDATTGGYMADEPFVAFEVPPEVTESDIHRVLGDDRLADIEQLSQIAGLDAYGWYVTFHQKRFQHGVHIPFEGILAFAIHVFRGLDLTFERKVDLSFRAILRHELFHFNVDCMTANWELTTGAAVFWNAKERYRNPHGYVPLEEALANAYMLRGFKYPTRRLAGSGGSYPALKRFCDQLPEGYRDAALYVRTRGQYGALDSYFDSCSELSVAYQQSSAPAWQPLERGIDTLIFYPDLIRIDWTRCPVIILDRHNLRGALGIGISYFQSITDIEETENFSRILKKLDKRLQMRWEASVEKLALSTSFNSLNFQPWKKDGSDYYSVNLDGNYRVHLRYDRTRTKWFAESIGTHKAMGHG